MTHHTRAKVFAVGLLLALLSASFIPLPHLFAAKALAPKHESRKSESKSAAPSTQTPEQPIDVVLAAPYWSTADGFVSTIEMKNFHVVNPLTVTPVLHLEHGGDVALDPVQLKPSETRRININQELAKRGLYAKVGAAEIRHAPEGAFGANLTVLNEPRSLIYNFQFRTPDITTKLEGLWWFYDEQTDGFVAAQNAGDADVTVTPTLYARERPYRLDPVKLRPHEMTILRLREQLRKLGLENETSGGISLESSLTGVLVADGGLVNPGIGFSAPLRMEDPERLSMNVKRLGQTLHAIGVTIGEDPKGMMGLPPDSAMNPIVNLRNITDEPISVRPVFKYDIDGAPQSFTLPEVRLNPQQVKRIDLLPYWESGQIFEQTSWGSLEINYTGRPGALIASVTSVDRTGTYVFDARIDNRLAAGFQGEYWSIEGDEDTAVTVKNITDKPAAFQLSLQYDSGRGNFQMQPVTLRPGEARMILLREVQHERVTGVDGKSLPVEATFGGLKLVEGPGGRHFLIDAVVFNPKTATCSACGNSCVYPRSLTFAPSSYLAPLALRGSDLAVQANMCDGTHETGWECECAFSSDDTTIATVDSACPSGGTGVSEGGTNFRGTAVDVPGPNCGDQTLYAACPVSVVTIRIQKQDGTELASPFRIGISSSGYEDCQSGAPGEFHDRTQHLKATVTPMAEAANVTISVSSSLTLSNQQPPSSGVITFDVVGNTKSTNRGDASITATDSQAHVTVTKSVSVVVPSQVGTPHDTDGGGLVSNNLVADCTTSPAETDLSPGQVGLVTIYVRYLKIIVQDQFTDPIGTLYNGAEVAEIDPNSGAVNPMNQSIAADSTYKDPVGEFILAEVTTAGSSDAQSWPNQLLIPMQSKFLSANATVEVDGFPLNPGITNRSWRATAGFNTLTISWP